MALLARTRGVEAGRSAHGELAECPAETPRGQGHGSGARGVGEGGGWGTGRGRSKGRSGEQRGGG